MIPSPTPSTIAWSASPIQRDRWVQAAAAIPRPLCKPFTKPKAKPAPIELPPGENLSEAAKQSPKVADHCFVKKSGRTLSDSAIHLLRLRDWYQRCLEDRRLDSEVMQAEWRLREQAEFIIGWYA